MNVGFQHLRIVAEAGVAADLEVKTLIRDLERNKTHHVIVLSRVLDKIGIGRVLWSLIAEDQARFLSFDFLYY
ncbi:hypothetical protein FRX31_007821 [Thalictrum thalictroides]|uniref:Uncharacterized protein n=1 Tax=Thalictrum thalictroides TaxID=46969 RepID=A0A7J6X2P4_THATH|nr:hypothetical protein FRX31_007821 [Thalictrum thalictroides]